MAKLNQIIAVVDGKKSHVGRALIEIYHKLQKLDLFKGISKTYRPKDEEGDRLPPESKRVQYRVTDALSEAQRVLTELFDAVATQDWANCEAKADIVVDSMTIAANVPVTHLLFLEKKLVDIHTFVSKLPTLDPAEEWDYSSEADCYATEPSETTRTKKSPRAFEASPATKEHPAQVQVFTEDVLVGYWTTVQFSGAIPEKRKNELLTRVRKLQEAVKSARSEANGIEVTQRSIGADVFSYLFRD